MANRVVPDSQGIINIGKLKENLATEVALPAHGFAGGSYAVMLQRPTEKKPYPVTARTDGAGVIWTVQTADTAIPGTGKLECWWYGDNGELDKSQTYMVHINDGLPDPTEAPEAYAGYVAQVARNAEAAKSAAGRAETALKALEDGVASGDFRGEKGEKGDTGPKGPQGEKGEKGDTGPAGDTTAADAASAAAKEAAQEAQKAAEDCAANVNNLKSDLYADLYDAVSLHNTDETAHNDLRIALQGLSTRINAALDSDDTTLDQMTEVVAYIKSNKSMIDAITTSKVSVADIVDNLTTNVSNKPLSAAQGVVIKTLIDALRNDKLDADELTNAVNTALAQAKASGEFDGSDGADGRPGENGITPTIGANGNWYLGNTDTGKPSRGEMGPQGSKGDTGSQGPKGEKGDTGPAGAGVPNGGTAGQLLSKTESGTEWIDPPQSCVQPDWNQNDSTAADYVKNRPFYTSDLAEIVLVEESTVLFADRNGKYIGELEPTFSATVGETYKVSWDGAVYESACVYFHNMTLIGNLAIIGQGSDTGEPFVINVDNGKRIGILTADTSASHTISISGNIESVVKINPKYLPMASKTEPGIVMFDDMVNSVLLQVEHKYFNITSFQIYGYGDSNRIQECADKNNSYGVSIPGGKSGGVVLSCYNYIQNKYITSVLAGGADIKCYKISQGSSNIEQLWGISEDGVIISSSTANSTKKFKITVDDSGTLKVTEVT